MPLPALLGIKGELLLLMRNKAVLALPVVRKFGV